MAQSSVSDSAYYHCHELPGSRQCGGCMEVHRLALVNGVEIKNVYFVSYFGKVNLRPSALW